MPSVIGHASSIGVGVEAALVAVLLSGCAPDARSVCQQACQKAVTCGLTESAADCEVEQRCDTLDQNPDGCTNEGAIVRHVNDCLARSCDVLTTCLQGVPSCAR